MAGPDPDIVAFREKRVDRMFHQRLNAARVTMLSELLDDIWRDAVYHPASPVISAALAAAQAQGASGEAFLRGVVTGFGIFGYYVALRGIREVLAK